MTSPRVSRPAMPDGYGLPESNDGLLTWPSVEARLVTAQHYWLATVRSNATPHVVPRWGVWLDGKFWYDGAPTTVHARNAERNPAVTLTLEDGARAVIVEGTSAATRADLELGTRLAEAFVKYHDLGYRPEPDAWSSADGGGLRVITPKRVLAWTTFPTDCTRFTFETTVQEP